MGELIGIIPRVEEDVRNGKLCVNDGGVVHLLLCILVAILAHHFFLNAHA